MLNGEDVTNLNIIANNYFTDKSHIAPTCNLSKNINMPKNINVQDSPTGTHSYS